MRIVGILLVRNEEFFARCAIRNALEFCDEFFAVENGSSDRTPEILRDVARESGGKVRVVEASHPGVSHDLIAGFAGSKTWVFGVDGDEIYDPSGLAEMRRRLAAGEFDRDWCVFGNVLNVKNLDMEKGAARGHLAPPCRSMTKLYNFAAIREWSGPCVERLHGGRVEFLGGYHAGLRRDLHQELSWEDSPFRCLHLCFLPRSPMDQPGKVRANIMDRHAWNARKLAKVVLALLRGRGAANWKQEKYARGPLVEKDARGFFQ